MLTSASPSLVEPEMHHTPGQPRIGIGSSSAIARSSLRVIFHKCSSLPEILAVQSSTAAEGEVPETWEMYVPPACSIIKVNSFFLFIARDAYALSIEDDRLIAVKQNAIFDVPAHRARQHYLFQVAALLN